MVLLRHASSRPSLRGSSLSPLSSSRTVSDSTISNFLITDIKQGVKNPNRANIFINNQYSFSLDVSQVVDFKLKVGLELSVDELAELKKASEFGRLYQRALEKALTRPHSEREIRDYLFRKLKNSSSDTLKAVRPSLRSSEEFSEFSEEILQRLITKGYVDDRKFAEFWVENRFVKKGVSRKRLSMELMKKGISRDIIDEVLDGRNDEEEILKIIAKKRDKYDDDKLISYLVRQGFSYQLAQSQVVTHGKD